MTEPQPDRTPSVIESIAETAVEVPDPSSPQSGTDGEKQADGGLVPPDDAQAVQPPA